MSKPFSCLLRVVALLLVCTSFAGAFSGGDGVGNEYSLQPDDVLQITVGNHAELSFDSANPIRIRPDGTFSFPLVGEISAQGKSVRQVTDELVVGLQVELIDPKVSVNLLQQRDNRIYVLGEVNQPGAYSLGNEPLDVKQAIAMAGGLTPAASLNGAHLFRAGQNPQPLDLSAQLGSEAGQAIVLQRNDTIIVARKNLVSVVGMVNKPGTYQIEDRARLADVLAAAGGIIAAPVLGSTSAADQDRAFLLRQDGMVASLNLRAVLADASVEANVPMSGGDTVVVPETRNQVSVLGKVKAEGAYLVSRGDRLTRIIALAGGATDEADLRSVKLIRRTGEIEMIDLEPALKHGEAGPDPVCVAGDTVIVPEWKQRVVVFGAVNIPGVYPVDAGDTILDALGKAGGYTVDTSSPNRTVLIRHTGRQVEAMEIKVHDLLSGKEPPSRYMITDGDLVIVPGREAPFKIRDVLSIFTSLGNLWWLFAR
jgi:polysaccharide export outer membrane protein